MWPGRRCLQSLRNLFLARSLLGFFLVLLILSLNVYEECEGGEEAFFYQDENFKGYRLEKSLLRKVSAFSVVDCSLECLRDSCCRSINYGQPNISCIAAEDNCELNFAKASDIEKEDLVKDENYLYYEMIDHQKGEVNFCCSSPCQHSGICDYTSSNCECPHGFTGRTCDKEVPGHSKSFPAKTCYEIKQAVGNSTLEEYWIQPAGSNQPIQVECDMETDNGGWTLVYRYSFTNYSHFRRSSNAVTPRPDWPAAEANVDISTTAPLNGSLGAVNFSLWKNIGDEFFIKCNINDWFICQSQGGKIVEKKDGSIFCKHVRNIVTACNGTSIPTKIEWNDYGPLLKAVNNIYVFEGATNYTFPVHEPCNGTSRNHYKKGVSHPIGAIYLRNKPACMN